MPPRSRLTSRLPAIAASMRPRLQEVIREGAEAVSQDAKARAPVRTGALRDSIHVEEKDLQADVIAGDANTFHGHLVEFGTVHSAPHPFLIPALESNKRKIRARAAQALRRL